MFSRCNDGSRSLPAAAPKRQPDKSRREPITACVTRLAVIQPQDERHCRTVTGSVETGRKCRLEPHDLSARLQRFDCRAAKAAVRPPVRVAGDYLWERAMPAKNHGHGLGVPARTDMSPPALPSCLYARFRSDERVTFGIAPKVTKRSSPDIRPWLRRGSLTSSLFRGLAAKGHPWPIAALATSMSLNPLHNDSTRPPEGAIGVVSYFCTRGNIKSQSAECPLLPADSTGRRNVLIKTLGRSRKVECFTWPLIQ